MGKGLFHDSGGLDGGPTLLLIHPMGADLGFWDDCRRIWENTFRCVAVDLAGAGRSPALSEPHSIQAHARELREFCRSEVTGPVVAIGCAVGAMIAAVFAARNRQLCTGLVLSNPGYRTRPEARAALAERAAKVRALGMASASDAVDRSFLGHTDPRRVEAYRSRFLAQDPEAYALQIEGMLHADISAELAKIACPALVVAGGRDVLLPVAHARDVAVALPDAELRIVEDAAHFIPYQFPDLFAGMVMEFLTTRLRPTS